MDPIAIIEKYYPKDTPLYTIYMEHAKAVADKSVELAKKYPELNLDLDFIYEAALLHDIGIFLTDAPEIKCTGPYPYICHGYLGADLLRKEGLHRHAQVCERHTGTGISLNQIQERNLPLPHRDMCPVSLEEQLICFVDLFYSKTKLGKTKSIDSIRDKMKKTKRGSVKKFDQWCKVFL
ncbi:MAG: HDIG domain-containing protein [Candidatus Azobacteroides sp.]|nr:HDIG domain-containing protein [Candidatus Azobacteroides sp.]